MIGGVAYISDFSAIYCSELQCGNLTSKYSAKSKNNNLLGRNFRKSMVNVQLYRFIIVSSSVTVLVLSDKDPSRSPQTSVFMFSFCSLNRGCPKCGNLTLTWKPLTAALKLNSEFSSPGMYLICTYNVRPRQMAVQLIRTGEKFEIQHV